MWATTVKQALAEGSTKSRLHASEELLCDEHARAAGAAELPVQIVDGARELRDLRHLDLRRNGLERLPEAWRLPQLETLDVGENRFAALPDELAAMPHLCACAPTATALQQPLPEALRRLVVLEPEKLSRKDTDQR